MRPAHFIAVLLLSFSLCTGTALTWADDGDVTLDVFADADSIAAFAPRDTWVIPSHNAHEWGGVASAFEEALRAVSDRSYIELQYGYFTDAGTGLPALLLTTDAIWPPDRSPRGHGSLLIGFRLLETLSQLPAAEQAHAIPLLAAWIHGRIAAEGAYGRELSQPGREGAAWLLAGWMLGDSPAAQEQYSGASSRWDPWVASALVPPCTLGPGEQHLAFQTGLLLGDRELFELEMFLIPDSAPDLAAGDAER